MRLGDAFPSKLARMRKKSLEVYLIEPKTEIFYLATKVHIGTKAERVELASDISAHKETSAIESGLPKYAKRKVVKIRFWKEGWKEETEKTVQ